MQFTKKCCSFSQIYLQEKDKLEFMGSFSLFCLTTDYLKYMGHYINSGIQFQRGMRKLEKKGQEARNIKFSVTTYLKEKHL